MNPIRAVTLGIAVGLVLVVGAIAPAFAAESTPAASASETSIVTNEPWSSPAYPVTCHQAGSQISCTPDDPSLVKPQQCFLGVLVSGARATVCTTYAEHTEAIKASGGKLVLVDYGCSLGDIVCLTFENAGRGMAFTATAAMFSVSQNMRFDTSTLLWSAATDEWSFWQWAILVMLFAAMVWAIAAAIVSGDRDQLIGAIVRSFIAIPAVPITLWMTGNLLNAIDDMTWYILNRNGPFELFATLQGVMWAGGQANYFFAFLIHGLLMISMFLLTLVFGFRNIVLAALIAVGPVAWMLFPVRGVGPQWVVRYVSAVTALLLTGPLTVGFVTLIVNGLATVKTIWDPQSWPLLIGLGLVAFAPFAIFGLFSFAGAVAADSVGSRLGSGASRVASNTARAAVRIPSRMGASPAGVAPASVRSLGGSGPQGAQGPQGTGVSGPTSTTRPHSTGTPSDRRPAPTPSPNPTVKTPTPSRAERTSS